MFGIGFGELLLVLVLALLVFGPEKLPKIASDLGKAYFDLRKTMEDVKKDIKEDFKDVDDIKNVQNELNKVISKPVDYIISQETDEEESKDEKETVNSDNKGDEDNGRESQ